MSDERTYDDGWRDAVAEVMRAVSSGDLAGPLGDELAKPLVKVGGVMAVVRDFIRERATRRDAGPAVGETYELVKTSEPSALGRRVTIEAVVADDWYAGLFGDARCYVRPGVYVLPETLASRYRLVAP